MDNIFTNLNEKQEVTSTQAKAETNVTVSGVKQDKKDKVEAMKAALKETIVADPDFNKKLRSLSGNLEVVNSLGFGDSGNIVVDKTTKSKDERVLIPTSQIVGYRVKNNGEPIKYQTEVWALDEATGKYVATKAEKTLGTGQTADFTRMSMTMFCAQPEISFQLANGKIIKGSGSKNNKDIKAELESYHFRFDKDENGQTKQINDDTVKLNIGEKVNGKWVVKAEYVETFGFLNNPKETVSGGKKSTSSPYTAQDLAANYVNKLIADAGL